MQMKNEFSVLNAEFFFFKQGLFSSTVEQHHVWEKTVNLKHKGKIDRIVNGKWKITAFSDMLDKSI